MEMYEKKLFPYFLFFVVFLNLRRKKHLLIHEYVYNTVTVA